MNSDATFLVVLIGALGGFGSYCFACALDVWRKRNGRVAQTRGGTAERFLRAALLLLLLGGITCMAVVGIGLLVPSPGGLLHGKDLLSVCSPDDLRAEWTTKSKSIEPGDVLACFRSPESEAEAKMLELTIEGDRAAKAALRKKPLEPDQQITRKLVDLGNERRHLEYRSTQLQLEHGVIERDIRRERLTNQNAIHRLRMDLGQLQREWAQARSDLQFDQKQANRSNDLVRQGVQTASDHEETARNVAIRTEEVQKIKECIDNVQAQEGGLRDNLATLIETMESQLARFGRQIDAVAARLQEVRTEEQAVEDSLKRDLARAADLRKCELQQIDADIRETEQELVGLEATLQQSARIAGHVVYRAPSPQAIRDGEPLLVIGPDESLRLCMRVPQWQRKALERESEVRLELVSRMDRDADVDRHFVERWFHGKLVGWRALPNDPRYGLAELSCEPPAEAVRYLASGKEILVNIRWWPSPLGNPLFLTGIAMSVLGAIGRMLLAVRRRAPNARAIPSESSTREDPPHSDVTTEYGAEGAMLHLLGVQLHEAIARHEIEPGLFAAVEWALDRHRARAIRLIGTGMAGNGLAASLSELVDRSDKSNGDDSNGSLSRADLGRLLRIVRTVAPEAIPAQATQPARQGDGRDGKTRVESHVHNQHMPR